MKKRLGINATKQINGEEEEADRKRDGGRKEK